MSTGTTRLTDADLDRIEEYLVDNHGLQHKLAGLAESWIPDLIAEVRRLRAAQITTLVACSRCDPGYDDTVLWDTE